MQDNEKNINEEDIEEVPVCILTDEETGEEKDFEILAEDEIDGNKYYALAPIDEESDEYVILRVIAEGDEMIVETIEDDDEFEKVEDYFNDLLFNEVDYDEDKK